MKNMFFGERKKCKALKLHSRIFAAISTRQMALLWFSTQPRTASHKHPTQSSLKMKNVDTRRPHQLIVASNARQSSIPQWLANRVLIDIQFTLINNSIQSRKAIPLDPEFFNRMSMTKLRYFTKVPQEHRPGSSSPSMSLCLQCHSTQFDYLSEPFSCCGFRDTKKSLAPAARATGTSLHWIENSFSSSVWCRLLFAFIELIISVFVSLSPR